MKIDNNSPSFGVLRNIKYDKTCNRMSEIKKDALNTLLSSYKFKDFYEKFDADILIKQFPLKQNRFITYVFWEYKEVLNKSLGNSAFVGMKNLFSNLFNKNSSNDIVKGCITLNEQPKKGTNKPKSIIAQLSQLSSNDLFEIVKKQNSNFEYEITKNQVNNQNVDTSVQKLKVVKKASGESNHKQKEILPSKTVEEVLNRKEAKLYPDTSSITSFASFLKQNSNPFVYNQNYNIKAPLLLETPLLFSILDFTPNEETQAAYDFIISDLKANNVVDVNMKDYKGKPFLAKVIEKENLAMLDVLQDREIIYYPIFDKLLKNINNSDFKNKLHTLNYRFSTLEKSVESKDIENIKSNEELFKSEFYDRNYAGKYLLKTILRVNDYEYAMDLWYKYTKYLPKNTPILINKHFED